MTILMQKDYLPLLNQINELETFPGPNSVIKKKKSPGTPQQASLSLHQQLAPLLLLSHSLLPLL